MKITDMIQPLVVSAPLAFEGDKNIIPESASGSNKASIEEGFPEITQLPLADGGLPPERADFNGMFYLSTDQRVFLQNGGVITFSEEVSTAIGGYPKDAVLAYFDEKGEYHLAQSLIDDNTYNFVESPEYLDGVHWQKINMGGSSRNIGEIVTSTLPLTDASLHLLDGSLLQGGGIYNAFVSYIKNLYETNSAASYFATEEDWQASVSTYGVCAKYVYNSVDNTVRLPKITGLIEGTVDTNALGQLVEAGLPALSVNAGGDHTHTGTTAISGNHNHSSTHQMRAGNGGPNVAGWGADNGYAGDATLWTNLSGDHTHTFTTALGGGHTHTLSGAGIGNSNTVQPQTVKAFVYVVVATSVKEDIVVDIDNIATDLNAKANIADTADNNLSNLTETGEKHFLNKTRLSNCVLEVPQRIKLEFVNGVLTLKAGSQLLQPDGVNDDGNWMFKYKTVESDIVFPGISSGSVYQGPIFIDARNASTDTDNVILDCYVPDNCGTGPSFPAAPNEYMRFWNTSDNRLYIYINSTWRSDLDMTFPIADVTINTTSIQSLDNVYNTTIACGNIFLVQSGVKVLMPNGLNPDGTLNNLEYTTPYVLTESVDISGSMDWVYTLGSDGDIYALFREFYYVQTSTPVIPNYVSVAFWYNPATNKSTFFLNGVAQERPAIIIGSNIKSGTSANIAAAPQKTPANLLKYSDKSIISSWGLPGKRYINLALGVSGSIYEAPATGWVTIDTSNSALNGFVRLCNETSGLYAQSITPFDFAALSVFVPARENDRISLFYDKAGSLNYFKFVYAEGEDE